MQRLGGHPVKTFTIGFGEKDYDESVHAADVARHIGTDHTCFQVSPSDALAVIPTLSRIYDEPFADASQVPTILVSKIAREHVTVALSGDGGDELFGGYSRYQWVESIWKRTGRFPHTMRVLAACALRAFSPDTWDAVFSNFQKVLPNRLQYRSVGDKIHKLANVIGAPSQRTLYLQLTSTWLDPEAVVLGSHELPTVLTSENAPFQIREFPLEMMFLDTVTYLPDDILVKVDRAAMSASLETRAPFLDHRVFELAWRFPTSMKIGRNGGKRILKDLLSQYVPRQLFDRPKTGFAVPIEHWLRGPLRAWAEELLDVHRLQQQGYLNVSHVRTAWLEHLSGKRNWQYRLWNVLMFQAWLDTQISAS